MCFYAEMAQKVNFHSCGFLVLFLGCFVFPKTLSLRLCHFKVRKLNVKPQFLCLWQELTVVMRTSTFEFICWGGSLKLSGTSGTSFCPVPSASLDQHLPCCWRSKPGSRLSGCTSLYLWFYWVRVTCQQSAKLRFKGLSFACVQPLFSWWRGTAHEDDVNMWFFMWSHIYRYWLRTFAINLWYKA